MRDSLLSSDQIVAKSNGAIGFELGHVVYFLINETNQIVYVGKTRRLLSRIGAHFQSPAKQGLFVKVASIPATDDNEAKSLELVYIRKFKPELNVIGRPDRLHSDRMGRPKLARFSESDLEAAFREVL